MFVRLCWPVRVKEFQPKCQPRRGARTGKSKADDDTQRLMYLPSVKFREFCFFLCRLYPPLFLPPGESQSHSLCPLLWHVGATEPPGVVVRFNRIRRGMRQVNPFPPAQLPPQVYSMNLELVGRMAPVQLTVSPQLLSPLANFAHSSKVRSIFSVSF